MDWLKNYMSYEDTGDPGVCPKCGSSSLSVEVFTHGYRRSVTIRCNKCKSGDHIDGYDASKRTK